MSTYKNIIHVKHEFPIFAKGDSSILILGSIPSVKSREQGFYYGHNKNRFWGLLATIFDEEAPESIAEKKVFLEKHQIALFDVICECDIHRSSDASIRNVLPNDIRDVCLHYPIKKIILNGKTAESLFYRYNDVPNTEIISLSSTSPANAKVDFTSLLKQWGQAILK